VLDQELWEEVQKGKALLEQLQQNEQVAALFKVRKGEFIKTVVAAIDVVKGDIRKHGSNEGKVNKANVIAYIEKKKFNTPLGKEVLQKSLIGKLNALETEDVTIEKIGANINAILNALRDDKKRLRKHYKAFKSAYKYENETEEDTAEIYVGTVKDDLNHLVAIIDHAITLHQQAKDAADEAEKEAERKRKEFDKAYEKWDKVQTDNCIKIITLESQKVGNKDNKEVEHELKLPKAKFVIILAKVSTNWSKNQPEMTKQLTQGIIKELNGDTLSVQQIAESMSYALSSLDINKNIVFERWKATKSFPDFAELSNPLIHNSDSTGKVSNIDIQVEYVEWFKTIGGAIDSVVASKNQQYILTKVLANFKKLLASKVVSFFYQPFEKKLKKLDKTYVVLSEVSQVWKRVISEEILDNKNNLQEILVKHDSSLLEPKMLNGLNGYLKGLVSQDSVKQALEGTKRPAVQAPKLANGELVPTYLLLDDGTVLTVSFPSEVKELDKRQPFINPLKPSLTIAKQGTGGYTFEIEDFSTQSPIQNGTKGVTVYLEYKLIVKKDEGTVTQGSSQGTTTGTEVGSSETKTDIDIQELSSTGGLAEFLEYTVTTGNTWGTEESVTESLLLSSSQSETTSVSMTKDQVDKAGYFHIKGDLYTFDIDKEGGTVQVKATQEVAKAIEGVDVKLGVYPSKGQTMRWKQ